MSETQYEEPVYVVSKRRRASEAVVHMPDCEKIHHQVEQDVRPEVYRETRVPAYIRFVANYMTLTELRNIGFRYHPCGYCQPPVPTVDGPIPISVKARNLNFSLSGSIRGGVEYLVRHNAAPDIPLRELATPAGSRTSVLNVQVLEDEHKSPLLKWDRVFPCPEQSETERNISWDIMSQLIFSVVCSPFRKRASNMPSAADPPGRSGRSRFRPAAGRFGKALHHGDEISGAA